MVKQKITIEQELQHDQSLLKKKTMVKMIKTEMDICLNTICENRIWLVKNIHVLLTHLTTAYTISINFHFIMCLNYILTKNLTSKTKDNWYFFCRQQVWGNTHFLLIFLQMDVRILTSSLSDPTIAARSRSFFLIFIKLSKNCTQFYSYLLVLSV